MNEWMMCGDDGQYSSSSCNHRCWLFDGLGMRVCRHIVLYSYTSRYVIYVCVIGFEYILVSWSIWCLIRWVMWWYVCVFIVFLWWMWNDMVWNGTMWYEYASMYRIPKQRGEGWIIWWGGYTITILLFPFIERNK